jgi:predicted nucleotide-binding protein
VVFELGFFFGRLGRHGVAVLVEPEVERPSDIDGLVYIPIDPAGSWKYTLVRELISSGIPADLTRVP